MAEIFSGLASMPFGDDEAEQHAPRDPKNTFFGIEFDVIRVEFRKDLLKISNQVISLFGLDYDVIDVGLNGSPDEVPETFEHTSLVRSPAFFRPNGIVT